MATPDDKNAPRDLESLLTELAQPDPELDFEKFMEGVEGRQKRVPMKLEEDNPQRRYNKLYGERAANRTRFSR